MLSDPSELSYTQITDQQQQINEITAEIVPPKFSLGTVGKHPSKGEYKIHRFFFIITLDSGILLQVFKHLLLYIKHNVTFYSCLIFLFKHR